MKWIKKAALFLVAALGVMQLIPLDRSNPSERDELAAPPEVTAILRRACYDCHSNETRWPWYARLAPISFLLWHDVTDGRKEVNFSTWDRYDARRRERKLKEIAKQVKDRDMPLWYYVPLHPDAQLSDADRDAIIKWANRP